MDQLDTILFDDFIKRKTVVATRLITDGILYGGTDWSACPKPTGKEQRVEVFLFLRSVCVREPYVCLAQVSHTRLLHILS